MKQHLVFIITLLLGVSCQSDTTKETVDQPSQQQEVPQDTAVIDTPKTKTTTKKYPLPPDTIDWVDVGLLDPTIVIDMRYATTNNFVSEKMYECGRCFLRPAVAEAVVTAHKSLQEKGYGLKMFDCYRPRPIQQKLWDKVPNPSYVTPPSRGSMHNRGAAVDLTIVVDSSGQELDMGTEFDYFGKEAWHTYTEHSDTIQANRTLLKTTMEELGFGSIRTEWWHYSYKKQSYRLSDWLWDCSEATTEETIEETESTE